MTTTKTRRTVTGHRITWYVYAGPYGERERLVSGRGYYGMGYDAACECGWESRTGGATRASVCRDVRGHKFDVTGDWRQL